MNTDTQNVRKEAYQLRQAFQFDKARALLQEALNTDLPPAERWALHYDLGKVHQDQFDMEQALHHYHKAINGLEASGESPSLFLARLYGACGLIHQDEGREEEALECHHRAVALLQQLPENESAFFLASNHKYLGELYQEQEELPKSREHYRSALPLLQQRLGEGEGFRHRRPAARCCGAGTLPAGQRPHHRRRYPATAHRRTIVAGAPRCRRLYRGAAHGGLAAAEFYGG